MIVQNSQAGSSDSGVSRRDEAEVDVQRLAKDIENNKDDSETKAMKIELLSEGIKTAYETIEVPQQVNKPEQQNSSTSRKQSQVTTDVPPSSTAFSWEIPTYDELYAPPRVKTAM